MKLSLSLTVICIGYVLCICTVCVIGRAGQANRPNIDVLTNGIADSENNLDTDPRVIKNVKWERSMANGLQRKISKRNFDEVVITPQRVDILLYLDELTRLISVSPYCELFSPQGHSNPNWAIWTVEDVNVDEQKFRFMIQTQNIGWQCLGHEEQIVRLTSCSNDDSVWQNTNNNNFCHNQECLATDGSNVYLENMNTPSSVSMSFLVVPRRIFSVQFTQDFCDREKRG